MGSFHNRFTRSIHLAALCAAGVAFALLSILASAAPSLATVRVAASCSATSDLSACDADHDTVPDAVERVVCGSATCSTGREDRDSDGMPDWVEVTACGSVTCASPAEDSVGDGVPDFARKIVCGSATCSTGNTDVNVNGVPNWASVVICGTASCSTGHEDYDADGVSDALQLAACVKPRDALASTGATIAIGLIAALAAALIAAGVLLARKRHLFSAALAGADA
ncbi:hypothetical protein [Leifsonia sp. 2MCAF36]|uniref:hypothetical protein n=1 Tax=Leifsonia sp. 2MCAF36 TaxID=3232988 RepID=UPI003F970E52